MKHLLVVIILQVCISRNRRLIQILYFQGISVQLTIILNCHVIDVAYLHQDMLSVGNFWAYQIRCTVAINTMIGFLQLMKNQNIYINHKKI